MLEAIQERLGGAHDPESDLVQLEMETRPEDSSPGYYACAGSTISAGARSENAMNLITTYLLFIVMPVALGFVVNFLALLLLVNADLLWPDLARGGRQ
jgi:hypothetical protein